MAPTVRTQSAGEEDGRRPVRTTDDADRAASWMEKSTRPVWERPMAPSTVAKMPNWAAAPSKAVLGLAIRERSR